MGIVPQFSNGMVAARMEEFRKRLDQAIIFRLSYLGEQLAKFAKDNHTYTDQTGNLTNSIGYAVARGNQIVQFGGENQPGEGAENARKVVQEYASTLQGSYSLIVVAGMNYAAYVEARGYNVILPAELKAKVEFPVVMRRLQEAANRMTAEKFGEDMA